MSRQKSAQDLPSLAGMADSSSAVLDRIEKTQSQILEEIRTLKESDAMNLKGVVEELRRALVEQGPASIGAGPAPEGRRPEDAVEDAGTDPDTLVLASYSPAEVVQRFAMMPEPTPPTAPERDDFEAAIGFVDVSGFTALSEKLAKEHGRGGAELLNQYINAYFAKLIAGINLYAGDVIKFAGDALQVVWRNRAGSPPVSTTMLMLRSAACCLYLLKELNDFSPTEGVTLKLHMGVGAGMLSGFYVGGAGGKWEYFVAGEPIEQMSDAADEATAGQLVISKRSYEVFHADASARGAYVLKGQLLDSEQFLLDEILGKGGRLDAVPTFKGTSLVTLMQPLLQAKATQLNPVLRCFVPQLVEERLDAGQTGSWVSEHRKLVSVFMKILGLGPKPCEVGDLAIIHEATQAVQEAFRRYDGTITRLITDDKGTRFLVAFGVPGHAHESPSDEARAVLACLEVVDKLRQIPAWREDDDDDEPTLQCCVGITTGQVFCCEAGWERKRVEYTLAGAKVNLAARLMQASAKMIAAAPEEYPGGLVLVEDETYRASTDCGCEWETLAPITVKGKKEAVDIHRPRGRAARESGPGRKTQAARYRVNNARTMSIVRSLIRGGVALKTYGRETEQNKIQERLSALHFTGTGGALLLVGEAGMGKTHLVNALKVEHSKMLGTGKTDAPRRLGLLYNASAQLQQNTPFFMWQAIFEQFFTPDTLQKLQELSKQAKKVEVDKHHSSQPREPSLTEQRAKPRAGSVHTSAAHSSSAPKASQDHHSSVSARDVFLVPQASFRMAMQAGVDLSKAEKPSHVWHSWPRWRQRWYSAVATVTAYQKPGMHDQLEACTIRPQADEELLSNPEVVQLAPLLNPVLPINIEDNEMTKQMTGEARMDATIRIMCLVLAAKLKGSRVVLVFEDVHWMDNSSWTLLHAAQALVQPLLVVLTCRPTFTKPAEYDKISKTGEEFTLAALQLPDVHQLLRSTLGIEGSVDTALTETITVKSSGNPLWAKEFIMSIWENGELDMSGADCRLADGLDIKKIVFPSSVETLITSRIDRLELGLQLLLKVASVIADPRRDTFNEHAMERLINSPEVALELPHGKTIKVLLNGLCDADMLARETTGQGAKALDIYRFKHASVKDVSYSILSNELKVKLHRAMADHFEKKRKMAGKGSKDSELTLTLGFHWKAAGLLSRDAFCISQAMGYMMKAGDTALDHFSLNEAMTLFTETLQLAEEGEGVSGGRKLGVYKGLLQRRIGQCHLSKGDTEPAAAQLTAAISSLGGEEEKLDDITEKSLSRERRKKVSTGESRGHGMISTSWFGRLFARGKDSKKAAAAVPFAQWTATDKNKLELAMAYELLSQVLMQQHNVPRATYCALRALRLGQSLPTNTPVVARAYASLCLTSAANSQQKQARQYKQLALSSCRALGELGQLVTVLIAAAVHEAGQANWTDASANLNEAMKFAHELSDKRQWEEASSHLGHVEFYRNNFRESQRLYEQASNSARERGDKQIVNRCKAGTAGVLLAMGELAAASELLQTTNSYGQHALALLRSGKPDEALVKALMVKDRFKGKRTKYYVLKGFTSTAEVVLELLENARGNSRDTHLRELSDRSAGAASTSTQDLLGVAKEGKGVSAPCNIDDAHTLGAVAQEWIDKLAQFSEIYEVAKPHMLLLRGQLLVINKQERAGLSNVRKSVKEAHRLRMPYTQALALFYLALHVSSKSDRQKLLHQALDLFKRVGATYNVERCAKCLDDSASLSSKAKTKESLQAQRKRVDPPV